MATFTQNRISERASLKQELVRISERIDEIQAEQASPKCTVENYIKLNREYNALTCKRASTRQRLTNTNQYWTNQQSYEPNITIAR